MKRLILCLLALSAAKLQADPMTKQQLYNQMTAHIQQTSNNANGLNGSVSSHMASWANGADPKWYGGNGLVGVEGAIELGKDFIANFFENFPSTFLGCFKFDAGGCCKRVWGVCVRWHVSYRWPVQQVLSHPFFQHRYLPETYFDLLKASGVYENLFYPAVKDLHGPMALRHASVDLANQMNRKSWAAYVPAHGPILPQVDLDSSEIDLEDPNERGRYAGGKIAESSSSNLNQLEYSIGPSLAQTAWFVLGQYFPFLSALPCIPPMKLPPPMSSQDPGMIDITRNPFLGFIFDRDTTVRDDLQRWLMNPGACQEWMMNVNRRNVPRDMLKFQGTALLNPLGFLLDRTSDLARDGSINGNGGILAPLPNSQLAQFDRMCTERWGGSIPFTTVNQLHDVGFVDAGKNFEKALRLGHAIWKTYIEGTSAANYIRYYRLKKNGNNDNRDAYQLTYNDEWSCKAVGDPGQKFAGARTFAKGGEHGLYSMTHWLRVGSTSKGFLNNGNKSKCCLGFDAIIDMIATLASL